MDLATVQKLQKRYYRRAVGAVSLSLVGYCILLLFLSWFCLRLGAVCWALGELWTGTLEEEGFWLAYRSSISVLQGSMWYFALSQMVLIPLCMTAAGWKCRRDTGVSPRLLRGKTDWKRLALGGTAAVFCYSICQLLTYLWDQMFGVMGLPSADTPAVNWALGDPWLTLVLTVCISPVAEEYLFRGVLLNRLRPYGDSFAIAASAVLFALMHSSLPQLFLALGVGLVLGWLAVRTGSLRTGILLHLLINLLDWGRLMVLDQVDNVSFPLQILFLLLFTLCGGVLIHLFGRGRLNFIFRHGPISIPHPWLRFFLHPGVILVAGYCLYRLIRAL